jgi:hypothetical protein
LRVTWIKLRLICRSWCPAWVGPIEPDDDVVVVVVVVVAADAAVSVLVVLVYAVFVAVAASPVFTSLYDNALLSSLCPLESRAQLAFLFFLSGCCYCCCTVKRKFYIYVRCCFVKVFMEAVGFYCN